jgi:polysaccharide biosynthesis protein PslH
MKILFVTPRFPYPPHKGDQAVAFHRMRTLGDRHELVLLTFYETEEQLEGLPQLARFCKAVHAVRLPRWRSYLNMLALGGFSRTPLQVLYYRSPAFRRKLRELLERESFDLVHGFMLRLGPYLEGIPVPRVLELIDSMQLNIGRTAERARGLRRLVYREELRRVGAYERSADRFAEALVFVSDIDRSMVASQRAVTFPLGVDRPVAAAHEEAPSAPVVVFSGNMAYAPNVDAALFFANGCWQQIRDAVPHAEFWIVGGNPAPAVKALASRDGIRVTGFVPDMAAVLRRAAVAIAPMRSGSGMQFKVLEAMACGLPVVVTGVGLGAIAARPGEELVVADAPADFAASVVSLLRDRHRREVMGAKARAFVTTHHSWDQIALHVETLYASLVPATTDQPAAIASRASAR